MEKNLAPLTQPAETVLGLTDAELASFLQTSEHNIADFRENPDLMTAVEADRAEYLNGIAQVIASSIFPDKIDAVVRVNPVPRLKDRTYIEALTDPTLRPSLILDVVRLGAGLEPHNISVYDQIRSLTQPKN